VSEGVALGGALDPAHRIGRHFAIVSALTTLVAALIPIAFLMAGAPTSRPSVSQFLGALDDVGFADVAAISIATIAVGLVLQPLGFALTQLLEGYWGLSAPAQRAAARSARAHLERRGRILKALDQGWFELGKAAEALGNGAATEDALRSEVQSGELETFASLNAVRESNLLKAGDQLAHRIRRDEAFRLLTKYPEDPGETMPTRLGNMLRRYERLAGEPYGLDAAVATSALAQVANVPLREYHDDARNEMDLSVRMVLVWAFASVVGLSFLWRYDVWLLVPFTTSLLAILSYRGAVSAAEGYGEALVVLIAVGRGSLYEALNVEFPRTSREERRRNARLTEQLRGQVATMRYRRR
jgi:hypothetical protein